jgi:hypothetical protein
MSSSSKQQQKFMGMVHALQKGDMKQSDASPEIKKVAKDMNPSDVKDFASTKHSGLPKKVKQEIVKRLKEYAMMIPNHQIQPSAPADSLRSDDEMDVKENFPANWLVGRVSDQHSQLGTTPREDYDDTNFDKEDSGQEDLENENMNEAPEIKTITKKEWSKIKKFNKHIGQDGTYYVMAYNDKIGTYLNPVKIVKESVNEELINEDIDTMYLVVALIGQLALAGQLGLEKFADYERRLGPIDSIKKWWKDKKDDKAIKSLIAKIKSDPEMIAFFKMSQNQQKGKFRKLLSTKLSSDEIQYLNRIKKSDLLENVIAKDGKVLSNTNLIGYYEFDRDSDSFWVDDVKKGKGQLSFDTKKEVEDYFKKNEKDALKHLGKLRGKSESITEATASDVIKDLDKVRHDLIKKVDVLIAKKKKLYSNVDIESPMSAEEKQLDKDIQTIFSQIQQLIQQKRKIKTESLNDELSGNDLEMVAGIIDILKQVKDKENRKEIALNMIKQFKEEDIDFDYSKFLSQLKEYGSNLTDTFLLPRHSDKLPGTPADKNAIDNPDSESGNLYEVGLGDWHFKAIQKLYQKAGSFGRKKIAAVITKNPNSNWNKIERELQDSDYYEISDYSDKLGLSEVVENLIKKKTK